MKSTRKELVTELLTVLKAYPSQNLRLVIERARRGLYHDFKSPMAFPKRQLVDDLELVMKLSDGKADLVALIEAVKDGEYDEPPTDVDREEVRRDVGPEEFDRLFPSTKRWKA